MRYRGIFVTMKLRRLLMPLCLEGVPFRKPLYLEGGSSLICKGDESGSAEYLEGGSSLICTGDESGSAEFCDVVDEANRTVYCTVEKLSATSSDLSDSRDFINNLAVAERYKAAEDDGFLGAQFHTLVQVWQSANEDAVLGWLRVPEEGERYLSAHPALLDGMMQLCGYFDSTVGDITKSWIPVSIVNKEVVMTGALRTGASKVWAVAHCIVNNNANRAGVMHLQGVTYALLPVSAPKAGLFERRWRSITLLAIDTARLEDVCVSIVSPGWDNFPDEALDCFTAGGLDCIQLGVAMIAGLWGRMDAVVVPLFCCAISGMDDMKDY
jgi:hypothetical protein